MLKFIYSFILTTFLTHCKAQDANDDFSKNINELKQYKPVLANDDDFDAIENRLIVDMSNGIQKVKIKDRTVDSLGFRKIVGQFLTTHKNKASLLVAGSFDHVSLDNLVVFARVFNQCKSIFDPNGQSKIYFKSYKDSIIIKLSTKNGELKY